MKTEFDDEIWKELYPYMFPESGFRTAREEVDSIIRMTGLTSGRVLDLACGPGRHAVPFALQGFKVTAVDRSPFLLGHARKYAERSGISLEWVQDDMRFFSRPGTFHLALSLYSSFGYFEQPEDNLTVLKNMYLSLSAGGMLLMDLPGREVLSRDFRGADHFEVPGMGYISEYRHVTGDWKQLYLSWEYNEDRPRRLSFKFWLYSGEELRDMLKWAGFSWISLYGGFDLRAYNAEARQLIAFAVK